ncbi:hypothetical protein CVU37_08615 [candidate division BRC1 bacterium HGW-BRC1-1]|jgi:lipopolysaccharide export system protein LptA|nr:MAG: hypothetical protein CVU37_08615 [candidate division BRC1 bacterium HGW-BRC1-1]
MRVEMFSLMAALLVASAIPSATAQETAAPAPATSGKSKVQMPDIAENRKPDEGEQTGLMSGGKPFALSTDPEGELIYNMDPDTGSLDSVTAKKGVVFTSEDMTLNADQMDYKGSTSELVASGKRVVVRQGDMVLTCQLFKYFPETQKSEFTGNPILYNKTKDGEVQMVSGGRITVDVVDGKPQVKISAPDGNVRPGMRSGGMKAADTVSGPVSSQEKARVFSTQGGTPPPATAEKPSEEKSTPLLGIPQINMSGKQE